MTDHEATTEGLLAAGHPPHDLAVTRRRAEGLEDLAARGVRTSADNRAAVGGAGVIVLAVGARPSP